MIPTNLLQQINTLHKTSFVVLGKYSNGEQGAYIIADQQKANSKYVLKWAIGAQDLQWMQRTAKVTNLLGTLHYPVASYLLFGKLPEGIYSIQSVLPGSPMYTLTFPLLSDLLTLNETQIGHAISNAKSWHQEAVETVLTGGEQYCLHSSLKQHSCITADLLQELQSLTMAYKDEQHRNDDIVHGDFQHANILVENERVSGVVDWDGFGVGDSIFDVATLLFYSYDSAQMREQIWFYALTRASIQLLSVYLSHLILRQVDWSLRYHSQSVSKRYIERGQVLLQDIKQRIRSSS